MHVKLVWGFEHQTEDNLKWGLYCVWEAFISSKIKRKTKTVMILDSTSILDLKKKTVFLDTYLYVIFP